MIVDAAVRDWARAPEPGPSSVLALRLARRTPGLVVQSTDPLVLALAGQRDIDDDWLCAESAVAVPAAQALIDGAAIDPSDGTSVVSERHAAAIATLEARLTGDPHWWVPAARCHVMVSRERERLARSRLGRQDLPFVLPGSLDPLQVEVLAAGDRVLPALHVDWMRKLSKLAAEAMVADGRCLGGWFWPVVRVLDADRLAAAARALPTARRMPPGARGLAAAYLGWLGLDPTQIMDGATAPDRVLAGLADLTLG